MLHNVRTWLRRPAARVGAAVIAAALWAGAVGAGWYALLQYDYLTSDAVLASAFVDWPEASRLPRTPGEATLIAFLHPKCPCSFATLAELQRARDAAAAAGHRTALLIVPVTPPTADAKWTDADVVRAAAALPGAEVHFDRGGFEAARFGARDSGAVLYFDSDGRRRFSGGVTMARGHEGRNRYGDALALVVSHHMELAAPSPVFGCRLFVPVVPESTPSSTESPFAEGDASSAEASIVDLKP